MVAYPGCPGKEATKWVSVCLVKGCGYGSPKNLGCVDIDVDASFAMTALLMISS